MKFAVDAGDFRVDLGDDGTAEVIPGQTGLAG